MDLKTFVAETLCQIQEGVREAIERTSSGDPRLVGAINPHFGEHAEKLEKIVEKVSFDVAVTVSTSGQGEAKAGLEVLGIGLSGKGQVAKENSAVSRIQFVVPIVPPSTAIDCDASRLAKSMTRQAIQPQRVLG
jgi:hypothetical protein